jgi:hypothetical protein
MNRAEGRGLTSRFPRPHAAKESGPISMAPVNFDDPMLHISIRDPLGATAVVERGRVRFPYCRHLACAVRTNERFPDPPGRLDIVPVSLCFGSGSRASRDRAGRGRRECHSGSACARIQHPAMHQATVAGVAGSAGRPATSHQVAKADLVGLVKGGPVAAEPKV